MSNLELDEMPPQTVSADTASQQKPNTSPKTAAISISGVRVGTLVGLKDDGCTPLVVFPGQRDSAALPARATVDLHGVHIGREVVLMFENADPLRPIILGCIARNNAWPSIELAHQVEVDSDGERLVVSAKEQLVLRCGKATITLTKAGKILIQGTYVSSRSSGVNRIKGGSVQLN
jgi:hypothetical protein